MNTLPKQDAATPPDNHTMMLAWVERLMGKVSPEPNTGCWLWLGATTLKGYGETTDIRVPTAFSASSSRWRRPLAMTHRVFFEAFIGPIPQGLCIDHLCRQPACVNPSHMEAVTSRTNTLRGNNPTAINHRATHCIRGHQFTAENTKVSRHGYRNCKRCDAIRQKSRYWRLKGKP